MNSDSESPTTTEEFDRSGSEGDLDAETAERGKIPDEEEIFPEVTVSEGQPSVDEEKCVELLRDVSLKVRIELGRGRMPLRDILRLTQGSVVELEKLAGDPLDIYVNDRLVARGEVLVLDDNFCVRVTEILSPEECFRVTTG